MTTFVRGGLVVAVVFEIIGAVVIVIICIACLLVLPFLSRALKSLNRSLGGRSVDINKQMYDSMNEMNAAQEQLSEIITMTESVKQGMGAAIGFMDRVIGFLNSSLFQLGLPLLSWLLFAVIAVPRGFRNRAKPAEKPRRRTEPIPPPSFEAEEQASR